MLEWKREGIIYVVGEDKKFKLFLREEHYVSNTDLNVSINEEIIPFIEECPRNVHQQLAQH